MNECISTCKGIGLYDGDSKVLIFKNFFHDFKICLLVANDEY